MQWARFFVFGMLGLILGLIAFGLVKFNASLNDQKNLAKQLPGQPWRWRKDWASSFVRSSQKVLATVLLVACGVLAIGTVPIFWVIPGEVAKENPEAWLMLILPIAIFGAFIYALSEWRRYKRYGEGQLQFNIFPPSPGKPFTCVARIGSHVRHQIRATLLCDSYVHTRRGGRVSNVWFADTPEDLVERENADGTEIEITFNLPDDALESTPLIGDPSRGTISWTLNVQTETDGPNLFLNFEIPVFRIDEHP